jgi:hypothetical protein
VARCLRFTNVFCVLVFLAGCGAANNTAIAKGASSEFHQRFNSAQDAAIYDAADLAFKKSANRDTVEKMFARIRRKMGPCTESNATSYFYNISTDGSFVELKYETKCGAGILEETFRWHMVNNRAELFNYNAQSPLLLTD